MCEKEMKNSSLSLTRHPHVVEGFPAAQFDRRGLLLPKKRQF